jgi:hypothetical protein
MQFRNNGLHNDYFFCGQSAFFVLFAIMYSQSLFAQDSLRVVSPSVNSIAQTQSGKSTAVCSDDSNHVQSADFCRIRDQILDIVSRNGSDNVLVAFDFDNVLLAMDQDLGSDQWFDWQAGLLVNHPESPYLVAKDFAGLLRVQGIFFYLSRMHPPESQLPSLVKEIQDKGCKTIVLTARGPEYRDDTEEELAMNGYNFNSSSLEIQEKRGRFTPYDLASPEAGGLTKELIEKLKLGPAKEVSYSEGIFMVTGQHRGAMLRTLLKRSQRAFKVIVHVEDELVHSIQMKEGFEGLSVDVAIGEYTRERGRMEFFKNSTKEIVQRQWLGLKSAIDSVFERGTTAHRPSK